MLSGTRLLAADSGTNKQNRERSAAERPGPYECHTQGRTRLHVRLVLCTVHPVAPAPLRSRFCLAVAALGWLLNCFANDTNEVLDVLFSGIKRCHKPDFRSFLVPHVKEVVLLQGSNMLPR